MRAMPITAKGQVTIPAEVRTQLGLKPRDKVVFEAPIGDSVTIRKADSRVRAMYRSITPRRHPEDLKSLRDEFERGVAEEVMAETEQVD